MKVGDYVRYRNIITKVIKIDRIKKIIPPDEFIDKEYYELSKGGTFKEFILKSSPNILDLIEVGDYVNGVLINIKTSKGVYHGTYDDRDEVHFTKVEDIKSIVTYEQFKSMEYKVGE